MGACVRTCVYVCVCLRKERFGCFSVFAGTLAEGQWWAEGAQLMEKPTSEDQLCPTGTGGEVCDHKYLHFPAKNAIGSKEEEEEEKKKRRKKHH